ncbi:hypothetical protein ACEWY4_014665 [Coilia grayii]|uniref:Uncharacterized protein n=1 Tax=Coilia grayii TaxID=363190 RepID=A0ABD1JT01_9TELE
MKNYINCSFNEKQERHSTLALIECGDACGERNRHGRVPTDIEPWPDCHNCISTIYQPFLKINIDQRKEEARIRTTQSKYLKNPVYIDRWRCNRGSYKSRSDHGQETDNPEGYLQSMSAEQKSDNESATGDNREKVIPQSNVALPLLHKHKTHKPNRFFFLFQNSGDVKRTYKHSLFKLPAKSTSQFCSQTLGHRTMVTGNDAVKDITLSAFKNNVVWCSRFPEGHSGLDKGQPKTSGPGSEKNKAVPACKGKRKGSDGRRFVATSRQLRRPAPSSSTTRRSHSQVSVVCYARLRPSMYCLGHTTLLPRSAPPRTLLNEPRRKIYSTQFKQFLTY